MAYNAFAEELEQRDADQPALESQARALSSPSPPWLTRAPLSGA